ncbi:DUF6223 family protein [Phytomonospora endophytica]|uniref:Uncharacterized membrane protein HdeD (DUF308 family) n=1 Tax=Phytomonospora endophytica TaxID=714109 RepID=A0A841FCB1_9ACTN|nr:DUF6223 family protein [Phytomonospora endophytica]MBB6032643.1 uncharacterized membrane protein HdeD (DUF308 family) [Phytomonospora endophytica]GIG66207.1 hypothetical protein Pen01_25020 [Phytomonospora endophytica]
MSSTGARKTARIILTTAGAALAGGFGLAAPAAAHLATEPATVTGWTADRVIATSAALVALAGAVVGVLALFRAARGTGDGRRRGGRLAVALSVLGALAGVFVIVTADGGPGTGNGIVGGYLAVVVGLAGIALVWLARARARRDA